MPEAKPEQDASIEEILESIRQIINEDEETPAKAAEVDLRPKAEPVTYSVEIPEEEPQAEEALHAHGGVLDLTDKVDNISEASEQLGEDLMNPDYDPDPVPQIDLQDAPRTPAAPVETYAQDTESLISERTADAAASEMAKLFTSNVAVERDEPARVGRVTLEDIARDLMRPLIKTWLDENLPRVIDKIVSRELEKIARRARDE